MHISRLVISNIRCFANVDLSLSPNINVLVGENNAGKSTIINAALTLQASVYSPEALRFGTNDGLIQITLAAPVSTSFPEPVRQHLLSRNDAIPSVMTTFTFHRSPTSSGVGTTTPDGTNLGFAHFPQAQPNNFIFPYLSLRRAGGLQEVVSAQGAFEAGGTHTFLQAKIGRVYADPTLRPTYEESCLAVLGFLVSTFPVPNGMAAGLVINARTQQYIFLRDMGAGVANALGLIVDLLVAENKLFLIEELENDMHPGALKSLLELVQRSAQQGNQFIISTHSNVVVRYLGSIPTSRVFQVERIGNTIPPESRVAEVPNNPTARRALLNSLGYDLMDYDLYTAWLILEESSAEAIIREFLIPWFAPKVIGRLRTIAASGANDVEARFTDLQRLMTFIHLEPMYRNRAWVWCDGDQAGKDAIAKLKVSFKDWPQEHFVTLETNSFESCYPEEFSSEASRVLAIADRENKRLKKAVLCEQVKAWLREDPERGKNALQLSCATVIAKLSHIEKTVLATNE